MINNTFDRLWRDISPFTIGFDRTFDALSLLADSRSHQSNFPPYNIRKANEDQYIIELAVAGFGENDLDVELEGHNLTIKGSQQKSNADSMVHQGLAARDFVKKFVLSEDMKIRGATVKDGILLIGIEREIPEHKKAQKINLNQDSSFLIN